MQHNPQAARARDITVRRQGGSVRRPVAGAGARGRGQPRGGDAGPGSTPPVL